MSREVCMLGASTFLAPSRLVCRGGIGNSGILSELTEQGYFWVCAPETVNDQRKHAKDPMENGHHSTLLRSSFVVQSAVKENIRTFLFWKSKKPVEYGTGNCGEPLPKKIVEPCKGCPSKCIEEEPVKKPRKGFFSFKREPEVIKEKPSNCEEVKPVEEKLTWWEMIFGPHPSRSWPDPCTCRLALRQKKMCRARNPKLKDSRYKETAGDVFLYTEMVKRKGPSCEEPQPKPPPSFKPPNAVLFKMMCADKMASRNYEIAMNDGVPLTKRPPRLPYEEMRPPERRRQEFNCQRGIRSQDVLQSMERSSNSYRVPLTLQQLNISTDLKLMKDKEPTYETKSELNQVFHKRSRLEQLKFLVQQKDTLHCMCPSC